ncbi:MAG: response regulator [Limisphaerales bacterium]
MSANSTTAGTATAESKKVPAVDTLQNEMRPARILVVDDQPVNIQIVGSVLGKLGHEIIPASDGRDGLETRRLAVAGFDPAGFVDARHERYEVCLQLKLNPAWKEIPVIFLSAADDKEMIVRALDSGGVDYVTKPFNQAELISRVRTQLALKDARDRLKQLAEDRDELLGILAHDLKNYLGGIHMSAELLRGHVKKFNDERLTLMTENIFRSSDLSLAFMKEFLANSAADHGVILKPVTIELTDLARTVVQQYQESALRKTSGNPMSLS